MLHWIPASSSHLHILVSVFPSVGLAFLLVLFVTALMNDNEAMKRLCLFLFAGLGVLVIPTYLSGVASIAAVVQKPDVSQAMIDAHYSWGLIAISGLVLTGVAAGVEWLRSRGTGRTSASMNNIVLLLGAATAGLMVMMVFAGHLGWEISHRELQSNAHMTNGGGSSQRWSHVHMMLNHTPTVGFVFALVVYGFALFTDNLLMKRVGLAMFVICAALIVPTYVTGAASMWALTDPPFPGISKGLINAHRDFALITLFGMAFTGTAAWLELWKFRHRGSFNKNALNLILVFAVITLAIMAETGHRGGMINHPEIRTVADIVPTGEDQDSAYWTPAIEILINNVIWFVPWQTLHFFGYSLIFGTVLAVTLRVLGFWKSVPFSAVHRFLPIAVFGVLMNVFSGMLMFLADTYRYANNTPFAPKMSMIVLGVTGALYLSMSDRLAKVKAGEDAPMISKAIAVLVLVAWTGVVAGGRLLPYL